jgi:tRNA pseudouridine55 synthase
MKPIEKLLNFGLINIDKPAGPTSYSVSEFIKRQLKLKKTSHMGTLDPKVTGVLPITLGRACKLAGYFIKHDKSYVGILETHKKCDIKELQKLIDENFSGKILQTPPHRSAVKREERQREVYFWKLLEASEDGKSFLFDCRVEGGTYIRKLCSDLGEMIGGAHMGELRRTEAGIFDESDLVSLDDFESAVKEWKTGDEGKLREMVMDAESAIREVLPVAEVDKSALKSLYIGRPLFANNVLEKPELKEGGIFALFCKNEFVGIYRRTGEEIIFARSEFVYN